MFETTVKILKTAFTMLAGFVFIYAALLVYWFFQVYDLAFVVQ